MARRRPDHRSFRVLSAVERKEAFESDDADERHLFLCLTTADAVAREVEEAVHLWVPPDSRHVLNALILAKADDAQISAGLDLSVAVLSPYRRLFFDRSVFRHSLDVIGYVKDELGDLTEDQKNFYTTAIQQGPEFLLNRFRVGARPDVDPRRTLQIVLNDTTDRFLTHRGQNIDAAVTKEALRWGSQAVHAAITVIDKGSDDRKNLLAELKAIMLKTVDRTNLPEVAKVNPAEVL